MTEPATPVETEVHHTNRRIDRTLVGVSVAVILGAALIDFIVQNTRSVRVDFFVASGHLPVAVALLGAALAGAFVVLAIGIAMRTQARVAARRSRKRRGEPEATPPAP
jgi:uncharacterized integral membrane protein